MSGFANHDDDDIISGINVTPLVDITLVLLIVFMVTATLMANRAIHVNVPKAAKAGNAPVHSISLVMDKNGLLFVNGKKITRAQAGELLKKAVIKDPLTQVSIAADKRLNYQKVINMISLVNSAGATNFALNVETDE